MRPATLIGTVLFLFLCAGTSVGAEFDAAEEFMCGAQTSGEWSYTAYRVSDGKYRELAYGRVPIDEVSKYGVDALYLPDGDQEFRPFIVRLGDQLYCSPSYEGAAYDASISWTSLTGGKFRVSGFADMFGRIGVRTDSGSVSVRLLVGDKEVWSAEATPQRIAEFNETVELVKGGKIELRVGNSSGAGPKTTEVKLHVTAAE